MDFGVEQSSAVILPDFLMNLILSIVIVVVIIVVFYIIILIVRNIFRSKSIVPGIFQKKIFLLTIPEIFNGENNEKTDIKELLSGIENFYANLGGLKAEKGLKTWFFGRYDDWSFEIVVGENKLISCYMAVPEYLVDHMKQQFLSQYPHCNIEEVEDYNIFRSQGAVASGYFRLIKDKMFPILTYKSMNSDPLTGVLSTLSKLPEGQTVAIQFVIRSARATWRKRGVKVASEMQQGKSLKQAMNAVSGGAVGGVIGKPSSWIGSSKKDNEKLNNQPEIYRLSPMEEQTLKSIEEKASKAGMDVNIRIVAFAPQEDQAKNVLRQVSNAFAQYSNYEYANGFKVVVKGLNKKIINDFIYRNFDEKIKMVLNTEEMTSMWHLPVARMDVPNIRWLGAKKLAPPVNMPQEGLILGENVYRGQKTLVRIKDKDRQRHMYVIGMTGTGKSYFMANLAIQDIKNGKGVCVVDPHGSLIEDYIMAHIPKERIDDVIYFDPSDIDRPIGLNMLEASTPQEMDFAASEMITIFYKLLPDPAMAGPMFEHYMRNALLALMADQSNPGTLVELGRLFTDVSFRREKLKHVKDILVKDFWEREYVASQKGQTGADMLSYVISKTGRFVENEMMRNIIGQPKSGINFRQVMDGGKILLINLSKGKVGEMNSNLLGLIAVSKLQMAAMARADIPEEQRKDFYLYVDEFQNFITDSISTILAEARKYKLNLIMAHQYIAQLVQNNDTKVRDAVFGNVGNVVSFRIGVDDSETIAKQLAPQVNEHDLLNVEKFNAYMRLLIDNAGSDTFNMQTLLLPDDGNEKIPDLVKQFSKLKFGRDKSVVESEILTRSKIGQLGVDKPPLRPRSEV